MRIYRVAGEHIPAQPVAAALSLPDKPSIAVLPFANLSGDPEQKYFADGGGGSAAGGSACRSATGRRQASSSGTESRPSWVSPIVGLMCGRYDILVAAHRAALVVLGSQCCADWATVGD